MALRQPDGASGEGPDSGEGEHLGVETVTRSGLVPRPGGEGGEGVEAVAPRPSLANFVERAADATLDEGAVRASTPSTPSPLRGGTMVGVAPPPQVVRSRARDGDPDGVALHPGALFAGDFKVVRCIGRGGMGTVYEAEQLSTGRMRALKVLRPSHTRGSHVVEARARAHIDSEHVVDVVVAGVDPATGARWIAMELLDGVTLAERMREPDARGGMQDDEAWRVLGQLARGVARAHEHGVVHADLKPENVFLARGLNGPITVKILDFGLALAGTSAGDTNPMASPLWMAPEQAAHGEITPATDVWSVGLVAFTMFTGRSYWLHAATPGVDVRALIEEITDEPLVSATARAAALGFTGALPEGFDGWFARCVAREPAQRFRSGREMAAALATITPDAATLPVLDYAAPPSSPSVRPPRPSPEPMEEDIGLSYVPRLPASRRPPAPVARPSSRPPPEALEHVVVHPSTRPPAEVGLVVARPASVAPPRPRDVASDPPPAHPHASDIQARLSSFQPPLEAPPRISSRTPRRGATWKVVMAFMLGCGSALVLHLIATRHTREPVAAPAAHSLTGSLGGPPAWGSGERREWRGTMTSSTHEWRFALSARAGDGNAVTGSFLFTPVRVTGARAGEQVIVRVRGTYEPTLGTLELEAVESSNPALVATGPLHLTVHTRGDVAGTGATGDVNLVGALVQPSH